MSRSASLISRGHRPTHRTLDTPAYNTVPARRTLAPQHNMVEHTQAAPKPAKKVNWSPEVREYVQRSFAPEAAIPGIERTEMETKLKQIITQAAECGTLESIDWTKLPLPQYYIQQELGTQQPGGPLEASDMSPNWANGSLKRKMDVDVAEPADETSPPWKKLNGRSKDFGDRISYASKSQESKIDKRARKRQEELKAGNESKYNADLEKRKKRFDIGKPGNESPRPWQNLHHSYRDDDNVGGSRGPVIGTCQTIEKRYLRLTAAPKPEIVRPLSVLEKTLEHLKKKWRQENDYTYICDQFKSLRQDLTVQHIKNEFTVNVYEIHARIALEKGDLGEFNQCQTQLRALYKESLGGHPPEFVAYRILYFIYTCNRVDMNDVLTHLTITDKQQPAVRHALQVRNALALGNYHKFFRLYLDTPNMGAYLMDMFVGRERLAALANICKAYKPDVNLRFLTEELGFESDEDCVQFLIDANAQHLISEKDGVLKILTAKAGSLFELAKATAFRKVDIKGQI
ncbi:hypothetical protein NA57DRAFT_47104 [Rhizodiscina lignyota]|uniref:PCI domain-containing protein n=1 Tax=Rhizodiscina lignyota TaxID=1504668 RepID=A0A9P4I383_9PEZI|nr:hypothetical protein NA57DRAFT_47104 [Rhizodiscina lignyota]